MTLQPLTIFTVDNIVVPWRYSSAVFLVKSCSWQRCLLCQKLLGLAWQQDPTLLGLTAKPNQKHIQKVTLAWIMVPNRTQQYMNATDLEFGQAVKLNIFGSDYVAISKDIIIYVRSHIGSERPEPGPYKCMLTLTSKTRFGAMRGCQEQTREV